MVLVLLSGKLKFLSNDELINQRRGGAAEVAAEKRAPSRKKHLICRPETISLEMEGGASAVRWSGPALHEVHVWFDPCSWMNDGPEEPSAALELKTPKASQTVSNQTRFNTLQSLLAFPTGWAQTQDDVCWSQVTTHFSPTHDEVAIVKGNEAPPSDQVSINKASMQNIDGSFVPFFSCVFFHFLETIVQNQRHKSKRNRKWSKQKPGRRVQRKNAAD